MSDSNTQRASASSSQTPVESARGAALARAADAETLAGKPGAIQLLLDSSHTDGAVSAQRVSLAQGADGAVPHWHQRSTELFFVVSGTAQLLAGEMILTLGEGDTVAIPPRLTHAFGAAPGQRADLLIVIAPGIERFGYFRQLAGVMAGELPPDSLLGEQQRYDTYFAASATWTTRMSRAGAADPDNEQRVSGSEPQTNSRR